MFGFRCLVLFSILSLGTFAFASDTFVVTSAFPQEKATTFVVDHHLASPPVQVQRTYTKVQYTEPVVCVGRNCQSVGRRFFKRGR